jgi:hypothetical protein
MGDLYRRPVHEAIGALAFGLPESFEGSLATGSTNA